MYCLMMVVMFIFALKIQTKTKLKGQKMANVSRKNTRLQQFIDIYSRWLIVEDQDYFEVVFGCCFANIHLNSKPVWLAKTNKTSSVGTMKRYRHLISDKKAFAVASLSIIFSSWSFINKQSVPKDGCSTALFSFIARACNTLSPSSLTKVSNKVHSSKVKKEGRYNVPRASPYLCCSCWKHGQLIRPVHDERAHKRESNKWQNV